MSSADIPNEHCKGENCVCVKPQEETSTVAHTLSSGCRTESCVYCRGGKEEEKVVPSRQCDLLHFYQRKTRRRRIRTRIRQKEAEMSNALLRRKSSKQGLQNLMRYVVDLFSVCFCCTHTERSSSG